jgi:hypothetical protein
VVDRYDFHTRSLPAYMALIEGREALPTNGRG